ncbi:hypothetical protein O3M35_000244 [Rhynocoris fuscipes]|uniref:HAT C-terminal dimerisation domain-containing protein n=1 Tax=Rhynocoris fuscipes TaxID=488301 RepID=A0AAW1DMV4_9HEMI
MADLFDMEQNSLENEIIILQSDLILQARKFEENFWKYVNREKYPNIIKCSEYIYSCFGSTYLCESAFSYLHLTKTKLPSVLTDSHTEDSLLLSLSGYTPNYDALVKEMQTQLTSSHLKCSATTCKLISPHHINFRRNSWILIKKPRKGEKNDAKVPLEGRFNPFAVMIQIHSSRILIKKPRKGEKNAKCR